MFSIIANAFLAKKTVETAEKVVDVVKEEPVFSALLTGSPLVGVAGYALKGERNEPGEKTSTHDNYSTDDQTSHHYHCENSYGGASGYYDSQTSRYTLSPAQIAYNETLNDFKNGRASVDDYIIALRGVNEENAALASASGANSYGTSNDEIYNYHV